VVRVAAHRVILCARCAWFRRALSSGMREAQQRRIVLHDTNPAVFDVFLRFVYAGLQGSPPLERCLSSVGQLADLLLLADRYEVEDLTVAVEAALVRKMDAESAVALLGLADQLGVAGLRRAAFTFLAARPHLLTSESLVELPDHLRSVLLKQGTVTALVPVRTGTLYNRYPTSFQERKNSDTVSNCSKK